MEKSPPAEALSQQYGGTNSGAWVSRLSRSWTPFIQLARLSPPAGLALIYFPHLFGLLLAAITLSSPLSSVFPAAGALLLGSFFFSNAAHAWNDLVDAPVDKAVARTKMRPIPRGAVTPLAALMFTVSQAAGAAAVLVLLLPGGTASYAAVNIVVTTYYPWAKQHTNFAQLVLGFCLAWGVMIGSAALGYEPFAVSIWDGRYRIGLDDQRKHVDVAMASLFVACVLWTVIYDTIYAHQDVSDDVKLGLKSMAVLFQAWTKPVLWTLLVAMLSLLGVMGAAREMGVLYHVICLPGCALSLGAMILHVDLKDTASCWWWFRYGFWLAGSSMAGGLLAELVMRLWLAR